MAHGYGKVHPPTSLSFLANVVRGYLFQGFATEIWHHIFSRNVDIILGQQMVHEV